MKSRIAELETERAKYESAWLEAEGKLSDALQRAATLERQLAQAQTVSAAAEVILADRWGGYGNIKARQAMWDFVYKEHGRHMLPQSHYDGVLQAGLRALAADPTETTDLPPEGFFDVQVGRDATIYYSARLTGASVEEMQTRLHKTGMECPKDTIWTEDGTDDFDNVEVCVITAPDGTMHRYTPHEGWEKQE